MHQVHQRSHRNDFAEYHVARVVVFIAAGGERHDMVAARDLNAAIEIGAGIHAVDELLELIPGVKVERIDIRVAAGDEAGEDLQHKFARLANMDPLFM